MKGIAVFFAAVLLLAAVPARATTFRKLDYVCPVGGERFSQNTIMSGSAFAHFLDGQKHGSTISPWPLVVCPGNGFVMFKRGFRSDELQVLEPFVQSEEYQRLRHAETSYWLAARLQEELGVPLAGRSRMLQHATWQASPEQYPRYVEAAMAAFAAACPDLVPEEGRDEDWLYCQMMRGEWDRRSSRFPLARERFERLRAWPSRLVDDPDTLAQYEREIAQQLTLIANGNAARTIAEKAPRP